MLTPEHFYVLGSPLIIYAPLPPLPRHCISSATTLPFCHYLSPSPTHCCADKHHSQQVSTSDSLSSQRCSVMRLTSPCRFSIVASSLSMRFACTSFILPMCSSFLFRSFLSSSARVVSFRRAPAIHFACPLGPRWPLVDSPYLFVYCCFVFYKDYQN